MKKSLFSTSRRRATLALGLCLLVAAVIATPTFANSSPDERTYSTVDLVSMAQGVLQHEGYLAPGSYTRGKEDKSTVHALTVFQSDHTLLPTGVMNDETITQLLSHSGQIDSDLDGVTDDLDRCPDTAKGTLVDAEGCARDSDNDSISDFSDRCPDTARGARVDNEGCPLDGDRDAVYDGLDRCPDTMHGARVDDSGCPLDGDRDAVYDGLDRCPDTARGVKVDASGCAEETRPASLFQEKKRLVLEGVNFATDTANLTLDSRVILDRVAESLKAWPETLVEIAGFADSTNTDAYNLRLSRQRAEAVRAYLVNAGVADAQVVAKGYGESRPIADNGTASGRAENRRVELAKID